MSTELIHRRREGYQLTGFYGGDARGYCLQITSDQGYVQVTREGAARLAADIFRHFLEIPGPADAQATLARAARLFEEALPKFNWGASALDANAIQLLNEVPGEVRAALKACALCGGEGHTAPNCPWSGETPKGIVEADFAELELRTAAAVAAGVPGAILPGAPCPTCGAKGFDKSRLGPDRCTFCDGTEGGNPPEEDRDAG